MNRPKYENSPEKWGNDQLTGFFDDASWNSWSSFSNRQEWFQRIIQVDEMFQQFVSNLVDPPNMPAAFMLVRGHSAFRAAARLAVATQLPESYALYRSAVEYAAYAVLLQGSDQLTDVWQNRLESDSARKRARSEITWAKALAAVGAADTSGKLADIFDLLYQRCIDYGAHPNAGAVFSNMKMEQRDDGGVALHLLYLSSDDDAIALALKTAVQVGFASLRAGQSLFPLKFQILLLDDRLDKAGSTWGI